MPETTETTAKKKGGWPKGKPRKPQPEPEPTPPTPPPPGVQSLPPPPAPEYRKVDVEVKGPAGERPPDNPFAGDVKPPPSERPEAEGPGPQAPPPEAPASTEAAPGAAPPKDDGKVPLGEEGARSMLNAAYLTIEGVSEYLAGMICAKYPEILADAMALAKLTEEERRTLEPVLISEMAAMKIKETDRLWIVLFAVFGPKGAKVYSMVQAQKAQKAGEGGQTSPASA